MLDPLEYDCDGITTVRKCREAAFPWGVSPAYWYVRRPLFTMDAPAIGWSREQIMDLKYRGFETAYWGGETWQYHTPKQFATPEEAWQEWNDKIRCEPAANNQVEVV